MSRVHPGEKHVNMPKRDSSVTGPSKVIRTKGANADYTKAKSLTSWLFLKHDITYATYRRKSKNRRNELRQEYMADTGKRYIGPKPRTNPYDDDYDWDDFPFGGNQ